MADWQAVYRVSDGAIVSVGTVIADPLPRGLAKKPIAGPPGHVDWNPTTLEFDSRPPPVPDVDRVDEFIAKLGPNGRRIDVTVRAELIDLLGDRRFRDPREDYQIREDR